MPMDIRSPQSPHADSICSASPVRSRPTCIKIVYGNPDGQYVKRYHRVPTAWRSRGGRMETRWRPDNDFDGSAASRTELAPSEREYHIRNEHGCIQLGDPSEIGS